MGPHVAVLGAGIVGASVAYHLAKGGARVTVLDRAGPAAGASGKSFGWINASFAETPAYYQFRRAAIDAFRALDAELRLETALRWQPSLWWEDHGADFDAHVEELSGYGYDAEVIDAARFAALEPAIADPPERAVMSHVEGGADAAAVAQALLHAAACLGARVVTGCEVEGLGWQGTRIVGLRTSHGGLVADHVVIAAGADSERFLAHDGIALPMANKRGIILATAPVAPVVDHIVMSPDIHFRQEPSGRIVVGEIFSGGGLEADEAPDAFADKMLDRLRARLPGVNDLGIAELRLGIRPVPRDGLPVIGAPVGVEGISLAAMHSGVTLAPLVGQLLAAELLSGDPQAQLDPFRPDRPALA